MGKKKLLSIFSSILFVMFFGITLENSCSASSIPEYNSSLEDTFISYDAYDNMLLYVGLYNNENYNTGESRDTKINIINNFITEWNDTYTTKISLKNLFFYKGRTVSNSTASQNLNWFIVKDQNSTNFITSINITQNANSGETMYRPMYFDTYLHNASGEISGISEYSATVYQIAQNGSSYTSSLSTSNSYSYLRVQYGKGIVDGSDLKAFHFYDACYFGLNENNTNDWYQLVVPGHTLYYGYGEYHITNEIILFGSSEIPTPTPVPTGSGGSGGSGGDGGSTDLSTTNGLITNVTNSLNDTPSGDDFNLPSSGDLIDSLNVPTINDPSTNFWLQLTDGFFSAISNDVRYYPINILGINFNLDNQSFIIKNQTFKSFLNITQSFAFVLIEYKIIRKLVNMFSSGVFSQILRAYAKIDISDLF